MQSDCGRAPYDGDAVACAIAEEADSFVGRGSETGKEEKKGGLFEDLSIAQVTAGALAAVTSMLLSSQIGVAGSVIGVAVASVVATVSSQVYKKLLSDSADKLRNKTSNEEDADEDDLSAQSANPYDQGGQAHAAPRTQAHPAASAYPGRTRTPNISQGRSVGANSLREHAAQQRKKKLQKRVIIVSIISALIAVALTAFVINVVTAGEGVGTKTAPFIVNDTTATTKSATAFTSTSSTKAVSTSSTTASSSENAKDPTSSSTNEASSSSSSASAKTGTSTLSSTADSASTSASASTSTSSSTSS